MSPEQLCRLRADLHSLVIFSSLKNDETLCSLDELLASLTEPPLTRVSRYAAFAAALFEKGGSLTDYLLKHVLDDDNLYVRVLARGDALPPELAACAEQELIKLETLSRLEAGAVRAQLGYDGYLPLWRTHSVDFRAAHRERMSTLGTRGYGIYASHHMFTVTEGSPVPVPSPDPVRLCELAGYPLERKEVVDNTLALLSGKPAANVLLYGDAGTGKSSTVKAVVNEYAPQGLRLIEIGKHQLSSIPRLINSLSDNPLRFILFIDDLSFTAVGDDFNTLKAVLEGSSAARAANFAVYVTSNRRHLVKESFADRGRDDIHVNETIQEICSLSDRFGLAVRFNQPDKLQYLAIVKSLRPLFGIEMDDDSLCLAAERFATERGGRSPRAARQLMERLKAME